MTEISVDLEVDASEGLSYTYLGVGRPVVRSIRVRNRGSDSTAGVMVRPRVKILSPSEVSGEWTGQPVALLPARSDQALENEASNPEDLASRIEDEKLTWRRVKLPLYPEVLGRLGEKENARLVVQILAGDDEVVVEEISQDLLLLAANQWMNDPTHQASLAALVMPNSRAVQPLIGRARKLLEETTGDPSTEGYQSDDPERPPPQRSYLIAEAVYEAIRERGINYSNPRGSFERNSQKVRSPQTILDDNAGTCLDTSVLYASCLAAVGLEPVLFLTHNHAFSGYFISERAPGSDQAVFPRERSEDRPKDFTVRQMLGDNDWGQTQDGARVGVSVIQMVETTTLCTGDISKPFKAACAQAERSWDSTTEKFDAGEIDVGPEQFGMIGVSAAWASGYAAPPVAENRLADEGDDAHTGQVGPQGDRGIAQVGLDLPEPVAVDVDDSEELSVPPRVRQWRNRLLDLSAGNQLLKMKVHQARFLEFDLPSDLLGRVDDALFHPETGYLAIRTPAALPEQWRHEGVVDSEFDQHVRTMDSPFIYPHHRELNRVQANVKDVIERRDELGVPEEWTEFDIEHRVHEGLEKEWQKDLAGRIGKVRSAASEVMLRNGTNSLYLALGTLSFKEQTSYLGSTKGTDWLAPLYLYPVLLEGGRGSPFRIRLDPSGSVTPNYCLREKLLREPHNLDLAELEYPEMDEFGIDFDKMLGSIERKIQDKKLANFEVQRRCVLGVFDYSSFRLWKDLKDDWETMANTNPAVKHLMYTAGTRFEDPVEVPDPRLDPYCPLHGNDSQSEAIQWALDGRSFRLEGPPGTGKTQTIANLIASCLAHGKKVLFVAEKATALNQVKKKLHSVGLANYCLELHAKGDKDTRIRTNIREQLTGALRDSTDPQDAKWEDLAFRISAEQQILDKYRDALHSVNEAELSLWASREELLQVEEGDAIEVSREFVRNYPEYWPIFRELTVELPRQIEIAGSLTGHRWGFVDDLDYEQLDKAELSSVLAELSAVLDDFTALAGPWQKLHAITDPSDLALAVGAAELSELGEFPTPAELRLIGGASWEQIAEEITGQISGISDDLAGPRESLRPSVMMRSDIADLARLVEAVDSANFFSAGKHRKALVEALGQDAINTDGKAVHASTAAAFATLARIEEVRSRIADELRVNMPDDWSPMAVDATESFSSRLELFRTVAQRSDSAGLGDFLTELTARAPVDRLSAAVVERTHARWCDLRELLYFSSESFARWLGERTLLEAWAESLSAWLNDRGEEDRYLHLGRWASVTGCVARLNECGLSPLHDLVLDGSLPVEDLEQGVRRGFLKAVYAERLEDGDIDNFDGRQHDLRIANLDQAYQDARKLMRDRIPGIVSQRKKRFRVALPKEVGETQDLLRELKPIRGQKTPIRTLITKYGESLTDVMPCLLMSPDSVATLLPVGSVTFDLVIFDEASQVPTANAIGALGRGRAGVVVGDTKQMPPTSFFASNRGRHVEDDPAGEDFDDDDDSDETNGDVPGENVLIAAAAKDVESILEEFDAARVPSLQLLCHFRSEDEILIAFSNTEIYDEPMLTFPSASGTSTNALDFRRVDGQFIRKKTVELSGMDKGHPNRAAVEEARGLTGKPVGTNLVEAKELTAEILRRLRDSERTDRRKAEVVRDPESRAESIIVVTFNKAQMDLVTELLRTEQDPIVWDALQDTTDEETGVVTEAQLKVRNLETVQGDEAETVMFSVAFTKLGEGESKNPTNNVPLRFGPVTQTGGYRRLNVAVTRAKREMIVFCSFDPSDMKIKPTSPTDTVLVQKFLALAKNPERSGDIAVDVPRSFHIEELAKSIKEMGYRVQTQLGLSELRVDVAVGQPEEDHWEVAVMVDGPAWNNRGSAEQRELLPLAVLGSRGWKRVMRVWLPSWIHEREAVLEEIRDAMDGTGEELPTDPSEGTGADQVVTDEPQSGRLGSNVGSWRRTENLSTGSDTPDDHAKFKPFVPQVMYERENLDHLASPGRWDPGYLKEVGKLLVSSIHLVLEAEAPVESNRLARLVANCWGLQKVMQSRVDLILKFIPTDHLTRTPFGDYVWSTPSQAQTWTEYRPSGPTAERQLHEIAPKEFTNALVDLVEHHRSVSREDGTRALASIFGFDRLTKKVRGHIEAIIDHAIQTGALSIDGGERLRVGVR
mgnify:FL=1|jgi:hypothetical protein